MSKYTPWFPVAELPSRTGYYQFRGSSKVIWKKHIFFEDFWRSTVWEGEKFPIHYTDEWRGLAKEPK